MTPSSHSGLAIEAYVAAKIQAGSGGSLSRTETRDVLCSAAAARCMFCCLSLLGVGHFPGLSSGPLFPCSLPSSTKTGQVQWRRRGVA